MSTIAYAHFSACEKSNEFEERRVPLVHNASDVTKIGRAVARMKAAPENMIFDCKVLSRTHATVWYEDEHFYLRDTKSSNGTFVNNQRLSKGGEESAAHEIFSGDIVQLGVDITENNKKATFSCIIAIARLVHPDGRESVRPHNYDSGLSSVNSSDGIQGLASAPGCIGGAALSATELFQLHQYIKEAAHREQSLRAKLTQLEELLVASHSASDSTWQALIDEDRLLSRIETLEGRLLLTKRPANEEKMRDELDQMMIEKEEYENKAKESVFKILQEKLEVMQKLTDTERALMTTESHTERTNDERAAAEAMLKSLDGKHEELTAKYIDIETELNQLRSQHGVVEKTTRTLKDENVTLKQSQTSMNQRISELLSQLSDKLDVAESRDDAGDAKAQLVECEAELATAKAQLTTARAHVRTAGERMSTTLSTLSDDVNAVCKRVLLPYAGGGARSVSDDAHSTSSSESGASLASEQTPWLDAAIQQLTDELVAQLRASTASLLVDAGDTETTQASGGNTDSNESSSVDIVRMEAELSKAVRSGRVAEQQLSSVQGELQSMRTAHVSTTSAWRTNEQTLRQEVAAANNDAEQSRQQMEAMTDELRASRAESADTLSRLHELQTRMERQGDGSLHRMYEELRARCDGVTLMSAVCLFIVFVAVVMAFNPFFSVFTATTDELPPAATDDAAQ